MASSTAPLRSLLPAILARRTTAATSAVTRRAFGNTAVVRGGGATPPLPPFARCPAPTEKLVENADAVFDDACAPELALDFDCQHIDSTEGLLWWLGGFGFFATFYQIIKYTDPESKKPCVNRKMNMVVENPKVGPPTAVAAEE